MNKNYIVDDLEKFTQVLRTIIFNGFDSNESVDSDEYFMSLMKENNPKEKEEMDDVLSQQESLVIVSNHLRKQVNKITKDTRYILNDDTLNMIIESLNSRLVSNLLMSLSKKGIIESAYDESINDFVFWVKDEDEKNKPETD